MIRVAVVLVLLCVSVTHANVFILSRNVDTNETTLSFEDDITGPFITVGEEDHFQNSSMMNGNSHLYGHSDDPDDEDFDDYDLNIGHLDVLSADVSDATEPKPSNFPLRRRKNTKKRFNRPHPRRRPNSRIRRPGTVNEKRKRIRVKTDQRIKPAVVSQFISDINKNCPNCRCGIGAANRKKSRRPATVNLEFPWLVHLSYYGRLYCAGTLINDRYVITAGHCTKGYITRMISVRLLEYEQNREDDAPLATRTVQQVFRPPSYDPDTLEDNIALLRIDPPVQIQQITPICLPMKGSSYAGKNAIVAGWGMTLMRNREHLNVLRKAVVPIITNKSCRRSMTGQDITRRMMCAGHRQTKGLDACQVLSRGDSGGPLMIRQRGRYRLAGIASYGQDCGDGEDDLSNDSSTEAVPLPPLDDYQSIHLNETHDLGLVLNNSTYQLLLPNSFLGNASNLDTLTEDDLKYLNEAHAANGTFDEFPSITGGTGKFGVHFNRGDPQEEEEQDEVEYEDPEEIDDNRNRVPPKKQRQCPTCQCGIRNVRRIVGGKVASRYLYPWTAILSYGNRYYCGGSLITELHVVTAGHCTQGLSVRKITAGFLQHDLTKPERGIAFTRKIASYKRHKRYDSQTLEHDIAILTMASKVPIGSSLLRPICLPDSDTNFIGKKGTIAGWGAVGEWSMPSNLLRHAIVPIMSNKKCRRTAYGGDIKKSMICAGYPERGQIDACQGDSGGPLMVSSNKRYFLAGVISWGDGCARRNHPGVYARVTNYINWIRNRSANACRCMS